MRRLIIGTAGNAVALWAAARIVGNVDLSSSWWTVILAALVLTLLNWYVKPVIKVLAFPLVIVTLGIALFFISMFMLWLTSAVVSGFDIDGFWPLVKATIIVWIVNMLIEAIFDPEGLATRRRARARPSRRTPESSAGLHEQEAVAVGIAEEALRRHRITHAHVERDQPGPAPPAARDLGVDLGAARLAARQCRPRCRPSRTRSRSRHLARPRPRRAARARSSSTRRRGATSIQRMRSAP